SPVTESSARLVYDAAETIDWRVGLGRTVCGRLSFSLAGFGAGASLALAASTSWIFFAPVCLSASARSFGSVILSSGGSSRLGAAAGAAGLAAAGLAAAAPAAGA